MLPPFVVSFILFEKSTNLDINLYVIAQALLNARQSKPCLRLFRFCLRANAFCDNWLHSLSEIYLAKYVLGTQISTKHFKITVWMQ